MACENENRLTNIADVVLLSHGTRTEIIMSNLSLIVGRRLHCILYGGRDGVIVAVNGTPRPETVRSLMGGAGVTGGNAYCEVVWDDGSSSQRVPEAIIYGVQWRLYDEVWTAEQVADAERRATEYDERVARDAAEAKVAFEAEVARLIAANPHMTPIVGTSDMSYNQRTKNLRAHLKKMFPGVKFSVRKDRCDVIITWVGGPDEKSLREETDKFRTNYYSDMSDCYVHRSRPWTTAFGGFGFISLHHN